MASTLMYIGSRSSKTAAGLKLCLWRWSESSSFERSNHPSTLPYSPGYILRSTGLSSSSWSDLVELFIMVEVLVGVVVGSVLLCQLVANMCCIRGPITLFSLNPESSPKPQAVHHIGCVSYLRVTWTTETALRFQHAGALATPAALLHSLLYWASPLFGPLPLPPVWGHSSLQLP